MKVLLTRPKAQCEKLGARLDDHGIEWSGAPLLRIAPVSWDAQVLTGRSAVVLTSANASRELLRVRGNRRGLTIYAVGPATAAPLRAAGFSDVHTADGTAESLIAVIRRSADRLAGRLVYLSGVDISCDIGACLAPAGIFVDRVAVYRAEPAECMDPRISHDISRNGFDAAVFLSVRTATTFCRLASAAGIGGPCARMMGVAISRKVAEALEPAAFRHVAVAATPSLDGIVDTVLTLRTVAATAR